MPVPGPATPQQELVLITILEWVERHGRAPRTEEIAVRLGMGVGTVREEVAALERDGWVTLE